MQALRLLLLTVLLCGAVFSQEEAGSPETTGEGDQAVAENPENPDTPENPENTDVVEEAAELPVESPPETAPEESEAPGM